MTFCPFVMALNSVTCRVLSPESVSVLRGVVVPGGDRPGGPHLHPPARFHPHHPRPEQKIHKESRIRLETRLSAKLSVSVAKPAIGSPSFLC